MTTLLRGAALNPLRAALTSSMPSLQGIRRYSILPTPLVLKESYTSSAVGCSLEARLPSPTGTSDLQTSSPEASFRHVIVKNLKPNSRTIPIKKGLSMCGKIVGVTLLKVDHQASSRESLALVEFSEASGAENAVVSAAIGKKISGRRIRVMPLVLSSRNVDAVKRHLDAGKRHVNERAPPSRSLSIMINKAPRVTEAAVRRAFGHYGDIESLRLITLVAAKSRRIGIFPLTFATQECATKALQKLNGTAMAGQKIHICYDAPPELSHDATLPLAAPSSHSISKDDTARSSSMEMPRVPVAEVSDIDELLIQHPRRLFVTGVKEHMTELMIRKHFAKVGKVESVELRSGSKMPACKHYGSACIVFASEVDAKAALALDSTKMQGLKIRVSYLGRARLRGAVAKKEEVHVSRRRFKKRSRNGPLENTA